MVPPCTRFKLPGSIELCATNSRTMKGRPSSRCRRTRRKACLVWTIDVSSTEFGHDRSSVRRAVCVRKRFCGARRRSRPSIQCFRLWIGRWAIPSVLRTGAIAAIISARWRVRRSSRPIMAARRDVPISPVAHMAAAAASPRRSVTLRTMTASSQAPLAVTGPAFRRPMSSRRNVDRSGDNIVGLGADDRLKNLSARPTLIGE